jgi:hypothetical protein
VSIDQEARAEAVRTGAPEVQLLACAECGVLLWDIDAHYRQAHATGPASATRETVTEEMVERAARAYWRKSMEDVGVDLDDWEESEREQYMWAARVVLEAALTEKGDES